jgi:predicted permease
VTVLARLRFMWLTLTRRARFESELETELRFHMDAYAADLVRAGVSPDEARRRARAEFGSAVSAQEECREARGVAWADEIARNLRYTWRAVRRSPGFASAAVLSLALGIGANTAIFSLMDAVMMRSLPVFEPGRLVLIGHGRSRIQLSSNYGLLEAYRAGAAQAFDGIAGSSESEYKVDAGAGVEIVPGQIATGNFHAVLGVPMALGRGFVEESDHTNAAAVISHRYWSSRFANDSGILGRTLYVNGNPVTVTGVTARDFHGITPGRPVDITVSMSLAPKLKFPEYFTTREDWISLTLIGRLRRGVSPGQAETVVSGVFQRYIDEPASRWVRDSPGDSFHLARLQPAAKGIDDLRRKFSTPLRVLFAIVALVLVVACANTSSLLLAKAAARQKEIAVRLSLGVSRAGLVRQLLTESLCLAFAGGAVGLLLSVWTSGLLLRLIAVGRYPVQIDASPNGRVLAFTAAAAILCGIVFGLAPALQALRVDTNTALKGPNQGGSRFAAGKMIVAAQVAVCFLLLTTAALLMRTFEKLQNADLGFDRSNLLLADLDAKGTPLTEKEAVPVFEEVLRRIASLPDVRAVSLSDTSPMSTSGNQRRITVPGYSSPKPVALWATEVSPDYFETFGIRLVRGRAFVEADVEGRPLVAVVSESMARRYFRGSDPIGRHFYFGAKADRPLQIVGLVKDAVQFDPREPSMEIAYVPLRQSSEPGLRHVLAIRSTGDMRPLLASIRKEVQAVNKQVAVQYVRTMPDQLNAILLNEILLARLSSLFAALAAVLACIGLYGVMAYTVARRTREMGVRVALGAGAVAVRWLVIRQAAAVVTAGLAVGIPAAYFASPLLADLLFDVKPADAITYAAVAVLLVSAGVIAAYLPARSASRINPVSALRIE